MSNDEAHKVLEHQSQIEQAAADAPGIVYVNVHLAAGWMSHEHVCWSGEWVETIALVWHAQCGDGPGREPFYRAVYERGALLWGWA